MISINGLSKRYGKTNKLAVEDLSLEVEDGEIFGFLGPNGAGKSTTIKCMLGILPFETGSIIIDDLDISKDAIKVKANIGYVPDNHVVYEKLTGREYIDFVCNIYKVDKEKKAERLERYVNLFSLMDAIDNPISSYSHGMKQKISVIAALVHEPKVWVLDEPMTGLDPKSAYQLKELMKEHASKGNCVFFSSHVLDVVEKLCDRVGIVNQGRLITTFNIDELKDKQDDSSLEKYFLEITGNNMENIDNELVKDGFVSKFDNTKML